MYPRSPTQTPVWVVALGGIVLIFGGYALYSGVLGFMSSGGNITAPSTAASLVRQTEQVQTSRPPDSPETYSIPTRLPTRTAVLPCLEFRVNVVKARVRDCPKDSCAPLDQMIPQGAIVCVFGDAPGASDWYQINLRPEAPYPEIAYMHSSVLNAIRPTPRPTRTPTGLPTVTPIRTLRPSRTPTPLPLLPKGTAAAP